MSENDDDEKRPPRSEYLVVTIDGDRMFHVVVRSPGHPDWLRVVASFPSKERADDYQDIEQIMCDDRDESEPQRIEETEPPPSINEPKSGLGRIVVRGVVAELTPPKAPPRRLPAPEEVPEVPRKPLEIESSSVGAQYVRDVTQAIEQSAQAKHPGRGRWTPDDVRVFDDMVRRECSNAEISQVIRRPKDSIYQRRYEQCRDDAPDPTPPTLGIDMGAPSEQGVPKEDGVGLKKPLSRRCDCGAIFKAFSLNDVKCPVCVKQIAARASRSKS